MLVAITGGNGFIGRQLALRHLAQGDTVRVLTRHPAMVVDLPTAVQLYLGDLSRPDNDLRSFVEDVEVLYHCAGEIHDPLKMPAVHVEGTARLLRAAEGRIGRWVQLSSTGVYGPKYSGVVTEKSPLDPVGTYEVTKAQSDQLVLNLANQRKLDVVVLRPSIVYGPSMTNRSLFQLIALIDKGLFFFIGAAGATANYIHVDNVVAALMLCGRASVPTGEIFNLSDSRSIEMCVAIISRALGKPTPKLRVPAALIRFVVRVTAWLPRMPLTMSRVDALTSRVQYATAKIEASLAYKHVVSMETGLCQMVQHWKSNS